jgi:hypothetical protein
MSSATISFIKKHGREITKIVDRRPTYSHTEYIYRGLPIDPIKLEEGRRYFVQFAPINGEPRRFYLTSLRKAMDLVDSELLRTDLE